MPILDFRDMLALPGGDNATDSVFGGIHLNRTTLEYWNYTLFSNGTLSNQTWCVIVEEPYTPKLVYPNGTFVNVTWCYEPLLPIDPRAKISIGLAVAYGLCLLGVLVALGKHGRMFLPAEQRFRPIGRRWQWYWGIFVSVAGFISLITNVDVDRYWVLELPIVLNVFFWFLMQMSAMAMVWEAVRHWGSWMERQFIDPNPFALKQDDRRAKIEFWMPLVFYLFLWLNFFLVVPRNWGQLEMQRDPDQTRLIAEPMATDSRFKAAAFCLFICWLIVATSLRHSIKHYKPRNRGLFNRATGIIRFTPLRFILLLPLALAMVAYQALCSWVFEYSILRYQGNHLAMFLGGYGPSLLMLIVQLIAGALNPNEDRELMRQRRIRGQQVDQELGLTKKPAWWKRLNGDYNPEERMRDRIARNVREIGGGRATARNIDRSIDTRAREAEAAEAVEMSSIHRTNSHAGSTAAGPRTAAATAYSGKSERRRTERTMQTATELLFPGGAGASVDRRAELMLDGPPPPYPERGRPRQHEGGVAGSVRPSTTERTPSTGTTNSITAPPQQIRSMLDV